MSYLRKGQLQPDKSYRYTCGKCNGKGTCGAAVCDWCYGKDLAQLCEQIKTARGERYYGLLKVILSVIGKQMHDYARSLPGITPVDIAHIHLKFNLNLRATWEWLEETSAVYAGTYQQFVDLRLRVKDLEAKAIKKYQQEAR